MKLIYFLVPLILLTNCLTTKKQVKKEQELLNALISLEKRLVNTDLTLNEKVADSLYRESLFFDSIFPKSTHKEKVLVFAAKSADGLNNNKENIKIIDQLLLNFPNSINAPIYLYNKGKIYEEKLLDITKAIIIYKEVIENYPSSEIAKNLTDYISFLSASKKDQIKNLNQPK